MLRFTSLLFLLMFAAAPAGHCATARDLWESTVQPLFDQQCVKCHGPLKQEAGLELDHLEAVLKGDEAGLVVVPGKPDESALLASLQPGADPHMPPKKQLSADEIARLRAWIIALGNPPVKEKAQVAAALPAEPSAAIDHFLALGWSARGITPAERSDDRTFVRRVYLDLAGRLPARAEADAFLFDAAVSKRAALVDRLLASEEYARTFREIWDALLMGRNAGRREQRRRDSGWYRFLETAFRENRPWDEVVRAMITARPEAPADDGAAWFLFERRNDHQKVAEAIAPVIYGTRIDCAQCHDHALAREIKQAHYWGLVAAFNRSKNVEKSSAVSESAVGGFINFTNLEKQSQPAKVALLNGRTIEETAPPAGEKEEDAPEGYIDPKAPVKVPKFSRRAALADAATRDNPLLARAFVNHTWAILLGRGIVHPVDEINSKHPASHPELLEWLAQDFAAHGFDTRRLVRAIVLSRVYQLAPGSDFPPEAFAAAAERPLTAETLARSARIASGREPEDATLRQAFAEAFPEVLPRVPKATIQQAMLLANSTQLASLFKPDAGSVLERLAALADPAERVREAFRLALVRLPDAEELAQGVAFFQSHPADPATALGELLWALVAGPEFLTNH